ncbi:NLR family CARD domain-containing protein 3-like [Acropora muricata]|uniref:NLR family CARD domain-containing protein 3-like n=1 Tax=Acropora muricata TaxID=159855 RepID=UPI0034E5F225
MGAPHGKHEEFAKRFVEFGIPEKHLRVKGYMDSREALRRLFCQVDLVLLLSRTEGFGLTGLEALSAGLPVIVSKNSGFGEALGTVQCGSSFVIDSEDPSAWTEAIKGIWNKDRKSRVDEVKALRGSYSERYSWSKQCKCLIQEMCKLVEGTCSEPEITAQAAGARELKGSKEFTGTTSESETTEQGVEARKWRRNKILSARKSQAVGARKLKGNRGPEFTETKSQAVEGRKLKGNRGLEFTVTKSQAVGARKLKGNGKFSETKSKGRKLKSNKEFSGVSACVPSKRTGAVKKKETEQSAARTLCPSDVIKGLRQVYQKCEGVILPVPWCEEFIFRIENIFTRLKIVEKEKTPRIVNAKEVTSMTSIFTPHRDCKKPLIVLIEGEPGMGKTTYCRKLVYDWASKQCHEWDESFPRIDVLLFLKCREIKSTIWDAIEEQILPAEIDFKEKEVFFQFLQKNPSKVLLVLDGLDEADPQKLEMYLKLIQRRQLPGCYIVLTSRHEAGSKVKPYTDTLLEIVGFTETDAECYIRKHFQHAEDLAEELISKLKSWLYKDLRELTQNPLNTLLLCVIFEDFEGILPSNRTQLYVEIVRFILRRYESKNGLSNRGKDLLLIYKMELMILGKTALDSLHKQELYFDDHKGDIKESLLMKFGFLSVQSGGSKRAPCDRYGFFHKSFQEFFSGYFLAFSIIDDVTNFHSVLTDARYMGELFHVFKFMSGIVAQQSEETALSMVQSVASILNETGLTSDKHDSYLAVAHYFINECQTCSGDPDTKLACAFGESLELVDVVVRSPRFLGEDEYNGTFFQALTFNTTVTNLKFFEGKSSTEDINLLAHALRVNTSLLFLDLRSIFLSAEKTNLLAQALRVNTSLSSLELSGNFMGAEGANSLAQALRVNITLSSLNLRGNFIGTEGANSLAQTLRVNTSLSSMDLSLNSIGDEGAISLAHALRTNTSLSSLHLSDNSIGDEGAASIAEALRVNTSLYSLDLTHNSIGDKGAISLAHALRVNSYLSSLQLSDNPIGDEGATSLAQALRVNTSLSSSDLTHNSIGDDGATSLSQALEVDISISSLDLCDNFIRDERANLVRSL